MGRSFYMKNRLDQMDIFKNRLLETGEYDLERLNSMSDMELNLRQAFHKVVPNASNLSYDEFKAMTKAKGKEVVVAAAQATGEIVGAFSAGLEKAASAEDTSSSKAMVCRNPESPVGPSSKGLRNVLPNNDAEMSRSAAPFNGWGSKSHV